jgi:hypothetical protein
MVASVADLLMSTTAQRERTDVAQPSGVRIVPSRRQLGGRRFLPVAEASMMPALVRLAATLAAGADQEVFAIPEFVGPYGIADLAVIVGRPGALGERRAAGIPPLVYEPDAAIVTALVPRQTRSLDDVAARLGWPVESVMRRIAGLLRINAVARTSSGRYVRHPALVPVGRLHVLEAKVRDWRRGRDQARRYQLWADTASLVLSRLPRSGIETATEFTRWRLGLAVADEWVRRPQPYRHSDARRLLASELVIAALDPGRSPMEPSPTLPLPIDV